MSPPAADPFGVVARGDGSGDPPTSAQCPELPNLDDAPHPWLVYIESYPGFTKTNFRCGFGQQFRDFVGEIDYSTQLYMALCILIDLFCDIVLSLLRTIKILFL